jgi:hypothetical protein
MNTVEDYIHDRPVEEQKILTVLHEFIQSFPNIIPKIRYNIPFYYRTSWICYLNPVKGGIEINFLHGHQIDDPFGLLKARGRKMVKGWIITQLEDIQEECLIYYLEASFAMDK